MKFENDFEPLRLFNEILSKSFVHISLSFSLSNKIISRSSSSFVSFISISLNCAICARNILS